MDNIGTEELLSLIRFIDHWFDTNRGPNEGITQFSRVGLKRLMQRTSFGVTSQFSVIRSTGASKN